MELLLHWMRNQEIDDKMLYKKAAIKQECFIRDQICTNLLHTHSFVISTHRSKSIVLPVYAFTMENGIKVICRENFYGWELSVKLPKDRPYVEIIPEDLLEGGYDENSSKCYIEGFKDEWIFEGYRLDKTQRNFSFGIYSDYDFYTVMYMLKHLYEKEDFSEDVKKLTKEYVVNSINQVYDKFGYNEMEMTDGPGKPTERRVMSGWEIFQNTYLHLDDYNFRKDKGLDYIHMDIVDKPEEFADYIIKYPEIGQTFVSEVKSYNFEF